jgi:hypothetical protein
MDDLLSYIVVTFHKIQELTTLVVQHVELHAFVDSFIDDIGVTSMFITKSIQDLDPMTHVFNGRYVVSLSNVQELFVDLTSWVEGIINEVNEVKQNELWRDVGLVFIMAYERIDTIRF